MEYQPTLKDSVSKNDLDYYDLDYSDSIGGEERKEKFTVIILCLFGLIFSIAIISITYKFVNSKIVGTGHIETAAASVPEENREKKKEDPRVRKIAYKAKGQLFIFDIEKNKKKAISVDTDKKHTALSWKNKNELCYSECDGGKCHVNTYSVDKKEIIDSFELEANDILALEWSDKETSLAYLFELNGELYLTLKNNSTFRNLGKFKYDQYKPVDFGDATYIRFSPNDERILLVNTYTYVNEPTVLVLDLTGTVLFSLEKEVGHVPTSAFFMSNDLIYFKKNDSLYVQSLEVKKPRQLSERIMGAFDFRPSPDKTKVTYWTYDWPTGVTTVWVYDIGNEDLKRVRDQESQTYWIDDQILVSYRTPNCIECPMKDLKIKGISLVDLKTKVVSDLFKEKSIELLVTESF
ncbi:MAG: hypothetical protein PHS44_06010 [Candidatus Dojkabacteria bacterium]|jgi:hypothetical protein|nr:hypothetical protein [Candidatus Dojkabacteria bacterium]